MIVTRYILKEVLATLIAVTSILFVIYISNRFVGYLADAASGELTTDVVLNLLFLKSITSLPLLLPLSLYLAVTIAMGRFYKDNEITALAACGIGLGRIIRSIFIFTLIYAVIVSFITMFPGRKNKPYVLKRKLRRVLISSVLHRGASRKLKTLI